MLESGCVSLKNEVNIMMKNVVDIVLGGKYKMFYLKIHLQYFLTIFPIFELIKHI